MESCSYLKLELYFYCFIILIFKGVVNVRNKSWRFGTLLSVLLIALLALGGCGGGPHNIPGNTPNPSPNPNPAPNPQPQVGVLKDWEGEWKSFYGSLDAPEIDAVCEKAAASLPAYTKKGVKSALGRSYQTAFDSIKVEGSGITFMDSKGASLGTLTYASRGVEKRKFGTFDIEWHQFEAASGASDKMKGYKYLVMLKVHSDTPEGVKHWHMRYGSESLKALIDDAAKAMWWPTLCAPGDVARLLKDMSTPEAVKEIVDMFKSVNPLDGWKGTWVNPISFLDDPLMKPVYEAVSKKAAAKGKTYTPEAVKGFMKDTMLKSDFAGGAKVEGNSFTFMDDKGAVKATVSYVFDGIEARKFGEYLISWAVFKAEAAGPYKYLTLLPKGKDSEDGFIHFHMRYGDKSVEALLDDPKLAMWFPTLCESTTTAAKFAHDMLEEADEMVGMLP